MGSTNVDVEKVLVDEPIQNEANYQSNPSDPVAEKEPEPEFDTGLRTWLQVVGSFFLFFNSWYDSLLSCSRYLANQNLTGVLSIHGVHTKRIMSKNCLLGLHLLLSPGLDHCSRSC